MKLSSNQAQCLNYAANYGHVSEFDFHGKTLMSLFNKGLLEFRGRITSPGGKIWSKWTLTECGMEAIKSHNESIKGADHAQ